MKIVFISNFLNHHQRPFSDQLASLSNVEYTFIGTEEIPEERKKMGYQQEFADCCYYRVVDKNIKREEAEQLCYESDIVVFGSAPEYYIDRRLQKKKITFKYNERFFKQGFFSHPGDIYRTFKYLHRFNNKNLFLLCSSAYTKRDSRFVCFFNKTFKWGYFPKTYLYDDSTLRELKNNNILKLLWVGRFLYWKHPEVFLNCCLYLKRKKILFEADIIGCGEMQEYIEQFIKENNLNDCINIRTGLGPDDVRHFMEKANIYLFTSDRQEGWGAVLNEAMNSGCAVVCSKQAGSTKYLIRNNYNGYIYSNGSQRELNKIVESLIYSKEKTVEIGFNAYRTIRDLWNSNIAAFRFAEMCDAILKSETIPTYIDGPLSKA